MGENITVTLVLYVNEDDKDTFSQSVDVAKVGNWVSIILHKWWKKYPDAFVKMRLSREDTQKVINGLQEALKDDPKDYFEED